jgi:hypothetical protein
LLALLLVVGCAPERPGVSLSDLKCYPPDIHLNTTKARQAIVIEATYRDGTTEDVTGQARYYVVNRGVAQVEPATILPRADGQTTLQVFYAHRTLSVPVTVTNITVTPPISFKLDVMPVFLKAGCNAGSCHGSARGKDGFHLSLFGYDPDGDYFRLTREQIGRRINLAIPEESLIVQKGLGAVQHTGGVRFGTNSELRQTLVRWLTAGATNDPPTIAKVTDLEIFPKTAVLEGPNAVQHFIVRARYSDGTDRDVTRLAVFISNNEVTAKVSDQGVVTSGQRGEAFIQARYAEFNVGAPVIVVPANLAYAWPNVAARNYIDEAIYAKLKKLRLAPSPLCDDQTFLRRAFLDLTGTLPTAAEVLKFGEDPSPAKREHLVDDLLGRREFAELWVMKWAELLEIRTRDTLVYPKEALVYFEWLREQMLANVPLDQIVQRMLTASGSNLREPAANYYQIEPDTLKLAENTAQVFMGMRIQCAQCHNHPFDRWTMNDYYGFAAFFGQVGRKPGDDPRETVIFDRAHGEVNHPVTGKAMPPKFLGGTVPDLKAESRREVLARWLTSSENPYFARNVANVLWAHFFGRGIIEPVDDARVSNPPSNPELLEALARHLVDYHYDFKKLVRDICTSRTYQLATEPNATNALDDRNFSKAAIRRIRAEVLLDCISEVTATQDKFPGLPRGARAVEIADGNASTYFLTTFGRASRTSVCSCEVKVDPNLSQALHLLNGSTLQNKIERGALVKHLLDQGMTPAKVIEELYLRCFGRKPSPDEVERLARFLPAVESLNEAVKADQVQTLNDLFWSLLNAKEFVFNH